MIHGRKFAIDTPVDSAAAIAHFDQCPDAMAALMPDDASYLGRVIACSRAYGYHFQEQLPDELRKKWDDDQRTRER